MNSNVIFNRSNASDNNDVWDDTALIKAYEKAVNKMKRELDVNKIDNNNNIRKNEKKQGKKEQRSKIEKFVASSASNTEEGNDEDQDDDDDQRTLNNDLDWKIGDHCVAIYGQDGNPYPGVIIAIDQEARTCTVRYDYYENEEEKNLDELIESTDYYSQQETITTTNEDEEISDAIAKASDYNRKKVKTKKSPKREQQSQIKQNIPLFEPFNNFPMPPPPPPLPAQLIKEFENLNLNQQTSEIDSNLDLNKKDAFYSMLMSWYMSGYHTGYYFGLTQKQFYDANEITNQDNRQKREYAGGSDSKKSKSHKKSHKSSH